MEGNEQAVLKVIQSKKIAEGSSLHLLKSSWEIPILLFQAQIKENLTH